MSNLQIWDFSKGLNNEFETAMVNEPSVFEPLKFYCIYSVTQMGFRRKSNKFCASVSHTSKAILEKAKRDLIHEYKVNHLNMAFVRIMKRYAYIKEAKEKKENIK